VFWESPEPLRVQTACKVLSFSGNQYSVCSEEDISRLSPEISERTTASGRVFSNRNSIIVHTEKEKTLSGKEELAVLNFWNGGAFRNRRVNCGLIS
jgi:hypothetical protein